MKRTYESPKAIVYYMAPTQILLDSNNSIPGGEPGNGIEPQVHEYWDMEDEEYGWFRR